MMRHSSRQPDKTKHTDTLRESFSGRLEGVWTMLAPLSHKGESHGTDAYLDTTEIIGANGQPTEVFVYHGNALRGMWRDAGTIYMLDALDVLGMSLEVFYLLFSGGAMKAGDGTIDIDRARQMRSAMPLLSVLGGAVGSQTLSGKLACGDAYPLCKEVQHIIPKPLRADDSPSWRQLITERTHTRMDDAKNVRFERYLAQPPAPEIKLLAGAVEAEEASSATGTGSDEQRKSKERPPQQMRYMEEVLRLGSRLWQRMDVRDLTKLELGALVSAVAQWSRWPYIGGNARIGMGRVRVAYHWYPANPSDEAHKTGVRFLTVEDNMLELSPVAGTAKDAYDAYLREYREYLRENKGVLSALLET